MNVMTEAFFRGLVNDAKAHVSSGSRDSALYGAKLGLFTNALMLSSQMLLADLVIPTYPGYAAVAVTWSSVFRKQNRGYATQSQLAEFQMDDDTTPTTVVGAFVVAADNTTLLWAELFDTPVQLVTADDAVVYTAEMECGNNTWGEGSLVT
jgi:hypothetical protein